jgi:Uma2 family endonuclease
MAIVIDERVPPLTAGDKLTREEFLRRWEAQPRIKLAELIGGIVYMPSPVSIEHGDMDRRIGTWLGVYQAATPGTESGHNATAFVLDDALQPDVNLRLLPEYGGGSWAENHYLHGVPELVAEVSVTSASYDLHAKYTLYESAGVPEYLIVLLFEREIRWHALTEGCYQPVSRDVDGLWRSRIFPGLWLDGQAMLAGDMQQVLKRSLCCPIGRPASGATHLAVTEVFPRSTLQ